MVLSHSSEYMDSHTDSINIVKSFPRIQSYTTIHQTNRTIHRGDAIKNSTKCCLDVVVGHEWSTKNGLGNDVVVGDCDDENGTGCAVGLSVSGGEGDLCHVIDNAWTCDER